MSKKRNNVLLLNDIIDAIATIEEYIQGFTEDAFYSDRKTKDAVVRNFEIIGRLRVRLHRSSKYNIPKLRGAKLRIFGIK